MGVRNKRRRKSWSLSPGKRQEEEQRAKANSMPPTRWGGIQSRSDEGRNISWGVKVGEQEKKNLPSKPDGIR